MSQRSAPAVGVSDFGGPDALGVFEKPVEQPRAGEVLVRVTAATVNPTDTLFRSGAQAAQLKDFAPPYVPGLEFSGWIEAVGEGVDERQVGEAVMGIVESRRADGGAYSRFVRLSAQSVVPVPSGLSMIEAATIPMNGMTAKVALDALGLSPGSLLLVTGGPGALGGYAIQLAKAAGLVVIADARDADAGLVRSLGAQHVVTRGDGMADAVRELAPDGVAGVVDAARLGDAVVPLLAPGGSIAVFRAAADDDGASRHRIGVLQHAEDTAGLHWLAKRAEAGELTPRIARVLPIGEAAEGHRLLEAGGMRGRIVLSFEQAT